ncbi:hypothetical protein R1Q26_05960 [Klebsiella quasipneumoniae]|uniref:hypothetical protein n=1 Tax=Klebsiella quasipneumoniae TaxID=1463165 RepID=UPI00292AE0C3|nr:hypothetical protein [Klebsiella quasipneumoniae]WPA29262.1 hypothetical protein R1Q26_05960 [Klebsiella quasipneumoniae]
MVDKTQRHRNHWTQWTIDELTFVEQNYGQLSATEIGGKLGRTAGAVIAKASLLGLTDCGNWSHGEKDFLKKQYGCLSTRKIAARLGRSVSAVRAAVTKLDLGQWRNVPWTEAELALMRAHYKKGIDGMKLLLPERSRGAIVAQAGKMGLTEARLWLPDEDRVLREIYSESGVAGVREKLPHRTIPAIKHRAASLGLRSFKRKKTGIEGKT